MGTSRVAIYARVSTSDKDQEPETPRFLDAGLVICSGNGKPLNPSNIRNRDHLPRLRRLNLPDTRIHDLRHQNGSYLSARRVDARTAADRLGHADPTFFMRTYTHPVEETQAQAAAVANELLTKLRQVAK